jgi:DNA repair protein RecN (Recombination protein N)
VLESLSINNIVLINKLNIKLDVGLCVLTGETGSGKSILLDALGLALGYRSSIKLLRNGEEKGGVIATFNIKTNQNAKELLKDMDIGFDDSIIIRRVLYSDGHTKAYINDVPITQGFLETFGEALLEIHGQNEQIGLLNSSIHLEILDQYGNLVSQREEVKEVFKKMKNVKEKLRELTDKKNEIEKEQDYISHIINEIESLNVKENEEQELTEQRIKMMNKEKILNILKEVVTMIEGHFNISKNLSSAQGIMSRSSGLGENLIEDGKNAFEEIIDDLEQANVNLCEAIYKIDKISNNLGFNGETLEQIEDRLFAIRGLARKLNATPNLLNSLLIELKEKLEFLNKQEVFMLDLEKELLALKTKFLKIASDLSDKRKKSAKNLSNEIIQELIPLKMDNTVFDVDFKELDEDNWNIHGIDGVKFIASTNPGMPMNELSKIASGGELSRFMLALKVVLSQVQSVPTLIFDEIDTGIGGAVADAVGERLKKLGEKLQVLVVTHHAQVASKGNYHLKVRKEQLDNTTVTIVDVLNNEERVKEIARMLSGETITDDAINVAKDMLNS